MTALISATSLPSGSGGWPIRFFGRSRRRSIRLERETPITTATVFIGNRPSAATAVAAAVFLTPWRVRAPLEDLGFQRLLAEQSLQLAHLALQGSVIRRRHDLFAAAGGRQRRRGRAGVGLPSLAEPGARAATTARQEDAVQRRRR